MRNEWHSGLCGIKSESHWSLSDRMAMGTFYKPCPVVLSSGLGKRKLPIPDLCWELDVCI